MPELANTNISTEPARKFSLQMRAVITIFTGEQSLYGLVSPFLDFKKESIDWEKIFGLPLCPGHKTACQWAFCAWRDAMPDSCNLFEDTFNADPPLRRAILKGLAIRWNI